MDTHTSDFAVTAHSWEADIGAASTVSLKESSFKKNVMIRPKLSSLCRLGIFLAHDSGKMYLQWQI